MRRDRPSASGSLEDRSPCASRPNSCWPLSALVFLIAGLVSLVYVHQLVKAAVLQTYDTNRMGGATRFGSRVQKALETGLKDRTVDPNNPGELRALVAETVHNDAHVASRARLGQPLFAHGIRREHRRQPGRNTVEHQSRQRRQAVALATRAMSKLRKANPAEMMAQTFREPGSLTS